MKRKEIKEMDRKHVIKKMVTKTILSGVLIGGLVFGAGSCLATDTPELASKVEKKVVEKAKEVEKAVEKEIKTPKVPEVSKIPEVMDINIQKSCPDLEGIKKDKKEVKGFTHKAHILYLQKEQKDKFVCATCHKGVKSEKEIIESDKCKRLSKEFEEVGGAKNFNKYFHNSCVKCHKSRKKEKLPTGPVSCKGCHNREGGKK